MKASSSKSPQVRQDRRRPASQQGAAGEESARHAVTLVDNSIVVPLHY
jgi:hypothetical protein